MSSWILFYKGLILGFSVAAPVGPIGILCIRRSLTDGAKYGLATGLGAATADALYGVVAACGLTLVSSVLVEYANWLRVGGSILLVSLGVKIFLSKPAVEAASIKGKSLKSSFVSSFFLTVTNPMTILSFSAAFAGLGVGPSSASAVFLVLGVLIGSALWWLFLSTASATFKGVISPSVMLWVNRVSGMLLVGLSVAVIFGLI